MPASRKICTFQQLLEHRRAARAAGKIVVHCHGCFDVVHPGHIHHLQHARSLGDLLIVSVSSDAHVNKGASRPLIPDDLRAGSLAALECVDLVHLNDYETAAELLEQLEPDIYVKGREYETSVDPRFLKERQTVVAHGGEVFFSSGDVVYSSTALIGSLSDTGAFNSEKIARYAQQHTVSPNSIETILRRCRGMKTVVVGDYILDRYHFCEATGVAGEGPMMALRAIGRREYDGGAAIVARHAAAMGARATLVTSLARDNDSHQVTLRLAAEGIDTISTDHRKQLVAKNRFVVEDQKVLKVDEGSIAPLDSRREQQLAAQILAAAEGAACVIFADFGYGTITAGLLERVMPELRRTVPIITADVSGKQSNLLRFRDVDLVCPTERELRETLSDFSSGIGAVVSELLRTADIRAAMITLGKQGLVACTWPNGSWRESAGRLSSDYLPALASRASDPLGAGDALLAAASLSLAAGATLQQAAFIGSLAAAVEVQQMGNIPVLSDSILDALVTLTRSRAAPAGMVA
ncbi:MAG: adenylyltransferase/cytidyltransferase family protein [Burkholderiales bacterium]|nr:adenylyltransferase/cytidyltransferase family protein [Phycisphaerae bacterium]